MNSNNSLARIRKFLHGNWGFTREISNQGWVNGNAQFTAAPSKTIETKLLYTEDGELSLSNGHKTTSYHSLIYVFERHEIQVFFNSPHKSNDLFITLKPTDSIKTISAAHDCKEDKYTMTYHFIDKNKFIITCQVIGPNKNYQIVTHYKRVF